MRQKLFWALDEEPYSSSEDKRKRQFVAVRMEETLFKDLMEKANSEGKDLSETIRALCRNGLKIGEEK